MPTSVTSLVICPVGWPFGLSVTFARRSLMHLIDLLVFDPVAIERADPAVE
jgi:hypothetical protein